jgi:hypothetical protein
LHGINISYSLGRQNLGESWLTDGFTFVGLTLNIRTDWKYVPAIQMMTF